MFDESKRANETFKKSCYGLSICDRHGSFLAINAAFSSITGYTQQELLGVRYQDITHPADRLKNNVLAARMYSGDMGSSAYEKRYVCKDGGLCWIRNMVSLLRTSLGDIVGAFAITEELSAPTSGPSDFWVQPIGLAERESEYIAQELRARAALQMSALTSVVAAMPDGALHERAYAGLYVGVRATAQLIHEIESEAHAVTRPSNLKGGRAFASGGERFIAQSPLTARERDVFHLVIMGKSSKEIAEVLRISPRTADEHRCSILQKLGFRSQTKLIEAAKSGLIDIGHLFPTK